MISFEPAFSKEATDAKEMLCYLDQYESALNKDAKSFEAEGLKVQDQIFDCCSFFMGSKCSKDRHILLLGGMGPLAGAYGARDVTKFIGKSASITLFQACGIPKRENDTEVLEYLSSALMNAIKICPRDKKIELIVLCNSAHGYMQDIMSWSDFKDKFIFYSLVEAVKESINLSKDDEYIVLQTDFTAQKGLYAGVKKLYSLDDVVTLKAYKGHRSQIIEGVKSFNKEKVLKHGMLLLSALKAHGFKKILLGCTELPVAIEYIRIYGDEEMIRLLKAFEFINPLHLVLQRLERSQKEIG